MTDHGYNSYSRGCRCEICRQAKAAYMRERRKVNPLSQRLTVSSTGERPSRTTARAPGATRYVSPTATHGTRAGYDEHKCRCFDCTDARMAHERRRASRKRDAA